MFYFLWREAFSRLKTVAVEFLQHRLYFLNKLIKYSVAQSTLLEIHCHIKNPHITLDKDTCSINYLWGRLMGEKKNHLTEFILFTLKYHKYCKHWYKVFTGACLISLVSLFWPLVIFVSSWITLLEVLRRSSWDHCNLLSWNYSLSFPAPPKRGERGA